MTHPLLDLHPSRLIDGKFGNRIPAWLKPAARIAIISLAWYGVVSGVVSVLSSLRWIIDLTSWVIIHAPLLAPYIEAIGRAVHTVVEAWRALTYPIYHLLFGWLNLDVPREILDILMIASIIASGYIRGWLATRAERKFRSAMSPRLTDLGRVAVVKRVIASIDVIRSPDLSAYHEKGWREFDQAVEELKDGVANRDADYLETLFLRDPEDLREHLMYVAHARAIERQVRRGIMVRSAAIGGMLLLALAIDLLYRAAMP